MIQKFTGVLLNQKGLDKYKYSEEHDYSDDCNRKTPVLIDTDEIESVFECIQPQFGVMPCQIRLKSGDNYNVLDSFERIEQLIKQSRVLFS